MSAIHKVIVIILIVILIITLWCSASESSAIKYQILPIHDPGHATDTTVPIG